MQLENQPEYMQCDVLVIGGGGTGISAAITARRLGADVIVSSKGKVGYANNTYISAGMLSSPGTGNVLDTPDEHVKDMVESGRSMVDPNLALTVARQAADHVKFLEECGVGFVRTENTVTAVQFPGHSFARNVQTDRKRGSGYMLPLVKYAKEIGVRFFDHAFITRLRADNNCISSAIGFNEKGKPFLIQAKSIILATGGFAQVYQNNNNAFGITGDGHAMAYDLGVPLRDMEFVQFYPVWGTFYEITIAMAGARLKNSKGEDILEKRGLHDPASVTRDQLSIAVFSEIQQGLDVDGGVILDFKPVAPAFMEMLNHSAMGKRINSDKEQVVKPCAHFCMGGLVVDEKGMTCIHGLYAAGEICGGVHGANRLGGNALAEVFSMGRITGKAAFEFGKEVDATPEPTQFIEEEVSRLSTISDQKGNKDIKHLTSSFKEVVWKNIGIIRNRDLLENAISLIHGIESDLKQAHVGSVRNLMRFLELENMILVSKILCESALLRTESRGSHYRRDFPEEDNQNWLKTICVRKDKDEMKIEVQPI
ncbi:MAG: FAD-binding protein [Proteobacteria bacterium]|nr:FAD-binding protein [Pseudomonadota bacterium]MBU4470771.1 FAD-binding protein [Pseudomonadota bacterium]MCG2751501.1 FAD-binding protein [Desulfobacteraceae bacterium]